MKFYDNKILEQYYHNCEDCHIMLTYSTNSKLLYKNFFGDRHTYMLLMNAIIEDTMASCSTPYKSHWNNYKQ